VDERDQPWAQTVSTSLAVLHEQSPFGKGAQEAMDNHLVHFDRSSEFTSAPLFVFGRKHLEKTDCFSDCFHGLCEAIDRYDVLVVTLSG
jgi:hypothetical protein